VTVEVIPPPYIEPNPAGRVALEWALERKETMRGFSTILGMPITPASPHVALKSPKPIIYKGQFALYLSVRPLSLCPPRPPCSSSASFPALPLCFALSPICCYALGTETTTRSSRTSRKHFLSPSRGLQRKRPGLLSKAINLGHSGLVVR
jgi:hypothetical protein